ncbi:MAG: hypothetical protein LM577_04505 [Thermoproteaceae archaeon]|nr:hypothetical protein [Thermoproteaceae archaeon]
MAGCQQRFWQACRGGRTFARPAGHARPFTLRALRELLAHRGFEVVDVRDAPGVEPEG